MVLNTAVAIGFFSQKAEPYALLLAALGAIVSLLWFFVDLGGKYWQSWWEHRASEYEKEVAPESELFFASKSVVQRDVELNLARSEHKGFPKWLDRQVLKKVFRQLPNDGVVFFSSCVFGAQLSSLI